MMIEHNTFGKRSVDNDLTDFLNNLREEPAEAKKIQKKVMYLMHDLNLTVRNLYLQQSEYRRGSNLSYFKYTARKHIPKVREFFKKDYLERLQKTSWRNPLKCKVHACIMERFRWLEDRWNQILSKI